MTILKKLGALTGASALVAAGLVAVSGSLAFAADLTAEWDANYYLPGDTATLKVTGCEPGGTINVGLPGASEYQEIPVPADGVIAPITYKTPSDKYGAIKARVYCVTEANPSGNGTDVTAESYILGSKLTAVPSSFQLGDTIEVTAGEFVPGAKVTLRVNTQDGSKTLWSTPMGNANEDRVAVSDVTFPTTLECGTYTVHVSSQGAERDNAVEAQLYMCGAKPTESPTPTTKPSETPTPKPSQTATSKPTPTKTPTKKPSKPGLPHTGA